MIKDSLVLFYSWSGNTQRVAQMIAEKTGADLVELQPVAPYPRDYTMTVQRARKEIREKIHPDIVPPQMDWSRYETVFLGTPNWCGTMAPPLAAFLYQTMPVDKNIVPFCTHGGGGAGSIAKDMAYYCIGCDVLPVLSLRNDGGAGAERQIDQWLREVERRLEMLRLERRSDGGHHYEA